MGSGPSIGIVAHTRKPNQGDHGNGRALLTLLAGSYVLTSVPQNCLGAAARQRQCA